MKRAPNCKGNGNCPRARTRREVAHSLFGGQGDLRGNSTCHYRFQERKAGLLGTVPREWLSCSGSGGKPELGAVVAAPSLAPGTNNVPAASQSALILLITACSPADRAMDTLFERRWSEQYEAENEIAPVLAAP